MKFLTPIAMAMSATAATVRIDVGQSGLTFSPNSATAAKGDIIEFHFHPINHSVVMGDFSNPCKPAQTGGFYSGFMPTSSGENVSLTLPRRTPAQLLMESPPCRPTCSK